MRALAHALWSATAQKKGAQWAMEGMKCVCGD